MAVALALTGCAAAAAGAPDLPGVVTEWRRRTPVPAVVVATGVGEDLDVVARGTSPDARFRIASITKSFVAVVVAQLVEEGVLGWDDLATEHLPAGSVAARLAAGATIRQLLSHTSGIPDYWRSEGFTDAVLGDRARRWQPDELLAEVADRDPEFAPGAGYSYSNTNAVVLAQVVTHGAGRPWHAEIRRRILDPLGLASTYVAGFEPARGAVIGGRFDVDGDTASDPIPAGPWPALETAEHAAGAMVSTAADLARFGRALAGGRLVAPATLTQMTTPLPFGGRHAGYGLGLEVSQPDYATTVWGHGGSTAGFRSVLWVVPQRDAVIVVLTNEFRSNPADLAELLLRRLPDT